MFALFLKQPSSDGFLDVPDEGAEAELLCLEVEGVEGVEEGIDAGVVDDGEDGAVHRGPGVAAVVGVAADAAASLHLRKHAEAPAAAAVEERLDALFIRLVVGYKYGFQCS